MNLHDSTRGTLGPSSERVLLVFYETVQRRQTPDTPSAAEKNKNKSFCHMYWSFQLFFILFFNLSFLKNYCSCFSDLYVQGGEVTVQLFWVIDVRLWTDRTNHVSDVFVSHRNSEVLREALLTHGALTGSQGLHLGHEQEDITNNEQMCENGGRGEEGEATSL